MISTFLVWTAFQIFGCSHGEPPKPKGPETDTTNIVKDTTWGAFERTPVWADEFDYNGQPDPRKWGYETGGNGFGNNELQYYTANQNAIVSGGTLKITARRENSNGRQYTSARIRTKDKGDWLYGRFEARIKIPRGRGTWPAFWMLPTDWAYGNWPRSGEIDIMEHVGYDQDKIHITVHTEAYNHGKNTQVGRDSLVRGVSDEFNLYRVDWTPELITGYINNKKLFEFKNQKNGVDRWPFDKRFHIMLNLAIGGNWGGREGIDNDAFPTTMEVDYVRVYKMVE